MTRTQIDKFRGAASDLGCDESEERFDAAMKWIARQKPPPDEPKDPGEKPTTKKPGR